MYSDTITIFNRYHSKNGDMWYPHTLHGVDLVVDRASVMAKFGAESKDVAKLHVKYQNVENKAIVEGLEYIPSMEWYKHGDNERNNYLTFNSDANFFDFFILGEYENKPISDSEYNQGFFAEMEDSTECYVITSVSTPYKLIPHIEILAR